MSPDELVDRLLEGPSRWRWPTMPGCCRCSPPSSGRPASSRPDADERVAGRSSGSERQTFGELTPRRGRGGHPARRAGLRGARSAAAAYRLAGVLRPHGRGGRPAVLRRSRAARGARGPGVVDLRGRTPATGRPGCSRTTTMFTTAGSSPSQGSGRSPTRPPRCTDGWPRRGSSTSHRSAAGTSRSERAHGARDRDAGRLGSPGAGLYPHAGSTVGSRREHTAGPSPTPTRAGSRSYATWPGSRGSGPPSWRRPGTVSPTGVRWRRLDGIHLTWAGFLTTEGFVDVDDAGTVSLLRYWLSERTLWLHDVFGEPTSPLPRPLRGPGRAELASTCGPISTARPVTGTPCTSVWCHGVASRGLPSPGRGRAPGPSMRSRPPPGQVGRHRGSNPEASGLKVRCSTVELAAGRADRRPGSRPAGARIGPFRSPKGLARSACGASPIAPGAGADPRDAGADPPRALWN